MWDQMDDCAKHYCCAYSIYLLSCLALEFINIIDKKVDAPEHGKYVVDIMNARERWMLKLTMSKLLNMMIISFSSSRRFMITKKIKL